MLTSIAWQSLVSRRKTVFLTFLSLVVSISVLISVEHIRLQAKESFNRTISGVDLIVGAPSGELNLLLYSIFRMGSPTNNIHFDSFTMLKSNPSVEWAVPISLGDSHDGFRVMGTNQDYFEYFKYGNKKPLQLSEGEVFHGPFDAVIGSDVANKLGYKTGDNIVLSHGIGHTSFVHHDQAPFTVTGIIAPTGTPVDKTVHVNLAAIEAIHLPPKKLAQLVEASQMHGDHVEEGQAHEYEHNHIEQNQVEHEQVDVHHAHNHEKEHDYDEKHSENTHAPHSHSAEKITAVLLGLNNKFATFTLQRQIDNYQNDRLMAVLPGVAMTQLWSLMGNIEKVLQVIGSLVLLASLFGLATMLLATMNERQKEIAVFRILGASPKFIVYLVVLEALIISTLAIVAAFLLVTSLLTLLDGWLTAEYGLFLNSNVFTQDSLMLAIIILGATSVTALIPSIEAYKKALHSQLSVH
ncbi:ABC transporter permease [Paraglaciecola aquimarina]|uniref:ABC transporter permease n=1 Tax=Paraglaciecola algarum TaxID=3050085 RepID=A0ABS9D4Y8_9ALTE|nr:ABC transporter permease [Paraglaciecola sp. G1-23]MCF2947507.1 ABC transporter permease [Paraglaciecola sp. G1-23]